MFINSTLSIDANIKSSHQIYIEATKILNTKSYFTEINLILGPTLLICF